MLESVESKLSPQTATEEEKPILMKMEENMPFKNNTIKNTLKIINTQLQLVNDLRINLD